MEIIRSKRKKNPRVEEIGRGIKRDLREGDYGERERRLWKDAEHKEGKAK